MQPRNLPDGTRASGVGALLGKTIQVGNYLVTVERKLGQGGFADVYQVRHAAHG